MIIPTFVVRQHLHQEGVGAIIHMPEQNLARGTLGFNDDLILVPSASQQT